MKTSLFLLLNFWVLIAYCKNKEPFYPSNTIPDNLLENANSVIRNRTAKFEILAVDKAIYTVRDVVTVLNQNGDSQAELYISYDDDIKPEIIAANRYDQYGELVDKVKSSEIYDQCAFDGFSLYTDARFKRIKPLVSVYPYTVEYEYSMQFNGVIEFPDWLPVESFNQSVEYSSFQIVDYNALGIRIKESMISNLIKNNNEPYRWEIKNFEAIEYEPYSLSLDKIAPEVKVSPVQFSYDGYPGKMDSWKNLGKWASTLLQGRDELPPERVAFLQDLVKDDVDTFDKIRKVYAFLQKKVRYVSIQLGIGGYQPFPATTVDDVGYGDCKALTNYMKSMLSAIGINSYYTLIRAGSNASDIDPTFPSQSFNHAILTVPVENDTVFLECTSSFAPCGFIGDFTDDRHALLVAGEDSKLIRTKKYNENINERNSKSEILVLDNGNVKISEKVLFQGLQYDLVEDEIRKTIDKQIESEYKTTNLSGVKIIDVKYTEDRSIIPSAMRMRELTVDKYAAVMGLRMFLPVNKLNNSTGIPKRKEERKYPFKFTFPFIDRDTVVYKIPLGYRPEYIPAPVDIASDFGKYKSELTINGQEIIYVRYNMKKDGVFPAEKYAEYVDFKKELIKADNEKLILVKTE